MGIVLCCLRVPDHEDERDNVSGIRASHYQSSISGNFMRKYQEVLRSRIIGDRSISSSQQTEPNPSFGNDLLLSSDILSSSKQKTHDDTSDDEDVCPTCFEDYTDQNPRVLLQCGHIFHLGCIYEWMEKSEACPFCAKMMLFLET